MDRINVRQVLFNLRTQRLNLGAAVTDGLERIDLTADLEALITVQPFELATFLVMQIVKQSSVRSGFIGISDGLEQFLIGSHGVGVTVVALLCRWSGIAGDNTSSVIAPMGHRQRHFNVTEWRGEQLCQLEINGRPLDVAEDVASGFVGAHATRVGVVPASANRHRDAVQDGHVLLMIIQPFQPVGQFMLRQVHFERLLLLMLFRFFCRKGGQSKLRRQVSVGLTDEYESVKASTWPFRRRGHEVIK